MVHVLMARSDRRHIYCDWPAIDGIDIVVYNINIESASIIFICHKSYTNFVHWEHEHHSLCVQ